MKTLMRSLLLLSFALASVATQAAVHANARDLHNYAHGHIVHNGGGRGRVVVVGRGPRYYGPLSYGVGIGLGVGLGYGFYGYPYSSWDYYPPRNVVVEHNTYVEQPAQDSDAVITNRANETSLLKDLQGHCFERSYDSSGRELRKELDPSACNF